MPVLFQGFAEGNVAVDWVGKKTGAQAVVGKFSQIDLGRSARRLRIS